jgi:hypothetical protein
MGLRIWSKLWIDRELDFLWLMTIVGLVLGRVGQGDPARADVGHLGLVDDRDVDHGRLADGAVLDL